MAFFDRLSLEARIRWAFVLVVLAVVFVFAIWPLHASGIFGGNCGSAFKINGSDSECASVINHRRLLLLGLGGGALALGLIGLQLAFGAWRNDHKDYEAEAPSTHPGQLSSEALDQLERLARLRDAGALTDDEFAATKARLLQ